MYFFFFLSNFIKNAKMDYFIHKFLDQIMITKQMNKFPRIIQFEKPTQKKNKIMKISSHSKQTINKIVEFILSLKSKSINSIPSDIKREW